MPGPIALPAPNDPAAERLACSEFRKLTGELDWQRLPAAVQRRFGRELAQGDAAVYMGQVAFTERTLAGWIWAQLLRCVGAPLPLRALSHAASTVVVTADAAGSQCWTRIYHESGRLPQVIRSMKSFSGPTGLQERVGGGIAMALTVSVESRALVFRSACYNWHCGGLRVRVPVWLTPGAMEVRHREEREGSFSFTLTVIHPWCGRIIRQVAYYRDVN